MQKITWFLWFKENNAEEAMKYYTSVFPDSKIVSTQKYPDESLDIHFKGMSGKILTGVFELQGQQFMCLDGGNPAEHLFDFNNAVSFLITCEDQAEIDYFWEKLSAKPDEDEAGMMEFMKVNDGMIGVPFTVIKDSDGNITKISGYDQGKFKQVLGL